MRDPSLIDALAAAFLAGGNDVSKIKDAAARTLGHRWRWMPHLAKRYVAAFGASLRPRRRDVIRFLKSDAGFRQARAKYGRRVKAVERWPDALRMQPVAAAASWELPSITTVGDLATWLGISPTELDWFADLKGLARDGKLAHYRYRVLEKGSGGVRLIEIPKPRLKALQRKILSEILDRIPGHPAAHGFRKGRSIKTFVAPHSGKRVVLRMDLQDFFPAISRARVQAFFRTAGYPETVADVLGGLCTNLTPRVVLRSEQYQMPHLPQGAPTSPALANFCAYRVDCRLAGLAQTAGAIYTRYADDLAFSGDEDFARRAERFSTHVAAILHEEGFAVHHRKTRVMRQGVRQHLAGLVANEKVNVHRADFDHLKAILTNCVRHGAEGQNRAGHPDFRAHLEGRIGFIEMVNPKKGQRLRTILEKIVWV